MRADTQYIGTVLYTGSSKPRISNSFQVTSLRVRFMEIFLMCHLKTPVWPSNWVAPVSSRYGYHRPRQEAIMHHGP
jgi:hypothetical protein